MHSQTYGHLLEQLGSLYGSGALSDRHGRFISATHAGQIHAHEGRDNVNPTMPSGPDRVPVTDTPITDTVLGEPQNDAVVEITTRGRFRDFAENV